MLGTIEAVLDNITTENRDLKLAGKLKYFRWFNIASKFLFYS